MKPQKLSDREQAGLHGPVKTYTEETEYPASPGTQSVKFSTSWTYDRDGRLIQQRMSNSNGSETVATLSYDDGGRLIRRQTVAQPGGTTVADETYSYDPSGKLINSAQAGAREGPSEIHYDGQGRKVEVRSFAPRPGTAYGWDLGPFVAAQAGAGASDGGTASTIYDDHDRAVEVQVRDTEGNLVSRVVRSYDASGRISQENDVVSNFLFLFPAPVRAQMLKESGASAEELNQEIRKKLFGGAEFFDEVSYAYDRQGRATEVRRRSPINGEQVTTTSYDDHGNVSLEHITHNAPPPAAFGEGGPPQLPPEALPPLEERRYTYVYDSFGNWTEKVTSWRSSADAPFQNSTTTRRTLTYY